MGADGLSGTGATGVVGAAGAAEVSYSVGVSVVVGTAEAAEVDEQSLQTETTEEVAGLTTVHPKRMSV